MNFDFDCVVDRSGTACQKYDARLATFGRADVTPLWVADMDFAAPPGITEALAARAAHPVYGYTLIPDSAKAALADWLARRHGWTVDPDWILLCPGVVPSLYAAVLAFAAPGDGVIVQPPVYFPFFTAVTDNQRRLVVNPLRLQDGHYTFDLNHLEQCAAEGAKLLLLCTPHNPVGRVWTDAELRAVLTIARRHDLVILSDEIHADLIYPDHRHHTLATLAGPGDRIVTAVAPSKTFNIPGLGLSCLIAPDPTDRQALKREFARLHVSPGNPFSLAAFEAAYRTGEHWLEALMAYLRVTRDAALAFTAAHLPGITAIAPEGTYLLWLDCRGLGLDDARLRDLFVREAGLGLSPGTAFGPEGSGFMRLNLGAPRALIMDALQRLAGVLARRR